MHRSTDDRLSPLPLPREPKLEPAKQGGEAAPKAVGQAVGPPDAFSLRSDPLPFRGGRLRPATIKLPDGVARGPPAGPPRRRERLWQEQADERDGEREHAERAVEQRAVDVRGLRREDGGEPAR